MSTFTFTGSDGTALRGWSNDGDGVPVVLSNGLGAVPAAWPGLQDPRCGYRVHSWQHRGTARTQKPADRSRITVGDHADDLLALMDARGVERALLACWSVGVNVGFEVALRAPDRVAGVLAVAGVPGGTFATMGAPLRLPRRLRHPVGVTAARGARLAGPLLTLLAARVPVDRRTAWLLSHSGFLLPGASPEALTAMLREFVPQDWGWYFRLAVASAAHAPMQLSGLECPVAFVAGRHDVLTSAQEVLTAADLLPDSQVSVLDGSHFLTLEQPAAISRALDELAARAGDLTSIQS